MTSDPAALPIPRRLAGVYAALRGHFDYSPGWWPGTPLEITLTAILVQQCDWAAAWAAVTELRRRGLLSLDALARAPADLVHGAIRPADEFEYRFQGFLGHPGPDRLD